MGCLNSTGNFSHWFGNIHLSGPCNRSCYFCIGQHMMELDRFNNLEVFPLLNLDEFITKCNIKGISEVNLTGSNTDPLLYGHISKLKWYLKTRIPGLIFGVRTNLARWDYENLMEFDKISVSITSLDPEIYKNTMGRGKPPIDNLEEILNEKRDVKVNIVLCPEILPDDLFITIDKLISIGITKFNIRQPYGQPNISNPFWYMDGFASIGHIFNNPIYLYKGAKIVLWDVHYTHVESVNLYANGVVSETYPVTKGHHPNGTVLGQENWKKSGRQFKQWLTY